MLVLNKLFAADKKASVGRKIDVRTINAVGVDLSN